MPSQSISNHNTLFNAPNTFFLLGLDESRENKTLFKHMNCTTLSNTKHINNVKY